jgi:hypothetical protein
MVLPPLTATKALNNHVLIAWMEQVLWLGDYALNYDFFLNPLVKLPSYKDG